MRILKIKFLFSTLIKQHNKKKKIYIFLLLKLTVIFYRFKNLSKFENSIIFFFFIGKNLKKFSNLIENFLIIYIFIAYRKLKEIK
jgi:hypothetical protein